MGRRGCRTSGKAGILSGWASTLHGSATAGKGHGGGATQRIVRGGGGKRRFPHESFTRRSELPRGSWKHSLGRTTSDPLKSRLHPKAEPSVDSVNLKE